jgi:hypothetical protein
MQHVVSRIKHKALSGAAVLAAMAAVIAALALPGSAAAYGPGTMYQVELSANAGGPTGGGVWLWLALNPDYTVDYAGSDCGHGQGASSDRGDATWKYVNGGSQIEIDGVLLNGLPTNPSIGDFSPFQTTITIPSAYGHYSGHIGTYETLPSWLLPPPVAAVVGNAQLQVAP